MEVRNTKRAMVISVERMKVKVCEDVSVLQWAGGKSGIR